MKTETNPIGTLQLKNLKPLVPTDLTFTLGIKNILALHSFSPVRLGCIHNISNSHSPVNNLAKYFSSHSYLPSLRASPSGHPSPPGPQPHPVEYPPMRHPAATYSASALASSTDEIDLYSSTRDLDRVTHIEGTILSNQDLELYLSPGLASDGETFLVSLPVFAVTGGSNSQQFSFALTSNACRLYLLNQSGSAANVDVSIFLVENRTI